MNYADFEQVMSRPRMNRYLLACSNDRRKAMTLYRLNLRLSQEMFTIISCFEVAFRNSIDLHYSSVHGSNWLRDSFRSGGFFDNPRCRISREIIRNAYNSLGRYSHSKLLAEMDFGFWRYLFGRNQYLAGGQTLLVVFPSRPRSSHAHYNRTYMFNQLMKI